MRTTLNVRVSDWRRRRREVALDDPHLRGGVALPERRRQVIGLRVFLDMDTAGMAKALGIAHR